MPALKARYWLLTIKFSDLPVIPNLSGDLVYLKGQQEIGEGGFHHWQLVAVFSKQVTVNQAKGYFCNSAHLEKSRSDAALEYVWKEDSRVADTQFEVGELPKSRARKTDWEAIYENAKSGQFDPIPKDILIRNYNSLKRIRVDNMQPPNRDSVNVRVYWGQSGTGKTRRAWHEAGSQTEVYIKNPNTKWWDGYRGQRKVIIDEFTGRIDWSYLSTWFDRYPCNVEVKGYSVPLEATEFWVTSNLDPRDWYTDINEEQKTALMRRIQTTRFLTEWVPPIPNPNLPGEWDDLMSFITETLSEELTNRES